MIYHGKLACPCFKRATLRHEGDVFFCSEAACVHAAHGFRNTLSGKPIFISPSNTDTVFSEMGVSLVPRGSSFLKHLFRRLYGNLNSTSFQNSTEFLRLCMENVAVPNILIIGSGEVGVGVNALYDSSANIVGIDVYDSDTVDLICDGHFLPFADMTFDGVWIQAVLEHVVRPDDVVKEIHRVLKSDGIVYAETPFMQQVHEGAFDFGRFTLLGHRYLFRHFTVVRMGGVGGPGEVLAWSIRSFVIGIFRLRTLALVMWVLTVVPLKIFDKLADKRAEYDFSSGVFFLGRKSSIVLTPKELVELYAGFGGK